MAITKQTNTTYPSRPCQFPHQEHNTTMVQEKTLVDEVSGWLRLYSDGSVDREWTGPPEVKFMADPVPSHEEFINGVATRDVVINDQSGHQVRIYLPKHEDNNNTKLPIIVHFHGGGFCITQANWYMYYQVYTKLACLVPAVVVSVYLPLAPEHRLPAACEVGFAALLWLRSVAAGNANEPWLEKYGDFNRVFLIGDSSGGNLVHEVAAIAGKEGFNTGPLRLAGGIPVHPGFVRSERSRSELEQPQSPFLTLDMVDKFLSLALPVGSTKDHPITCPMGAGAPPLEELKLPPLLLCLADKDLLWDTETEYYEAIKKAGKDVDLFISNDVGHSFYLNKIAVDMDPTTAAETEKLLAGIAEFIRKH